MAMNAWWLKLRESLLQPARLKAGPTSQVVPMPEQSAAERLNGNALHARRATSGKSSTTNAWRSHHDADDLRATRWRRHEARAF